MSKQTWTDEALEAHLREAAPMAVPAELRSRTLAALPVRRPARRLRPWLAAAAAVLALLSVPATLAAVSAMSGTILGVEFRISDLSPREWFERGFRNWTPSPGDPEFLSPEETAAVATFPIRTPTWLPGGMKANDQPRGAYVRMEMNGTWHQTGDFFVSQTFKAGDTHLSIMQKEIPAGSKFLFPPQTKQLTIAGHPAFLRESQPWVKVDEEMERRLQEGKLPEVFERRNGLIIWVEEEDQSITEINVSGTLESETLIRIAESLFTQGN
ncbi:MAG: hypothetical protein ACOY93_18415 [Bacillota bacterium]